MRRLDIFLFHDGTNQAARLFVTSRGRQATTTGAEFVKIMRRLDIFLFHDGTNQAARLFVTSRGELLR